MRSKNPSPDLGEVFGELISGTVEEIGGRITKHRAKSPREKAVARGRYGAALWVMATYGVMYAPTLTGHSAGELVTVLSHAPEAAPPIVWLPVALWSAAVMLGFVWLLSAIRGTNSAGGDSMAAFWATVRIAGCGGVIWWSLSGSASWVRLLHPALIIFIVMDVVGIGLQLRSGRRAERIVARQIEATAIPWRQARRRWWQRR